MPKEVYLNMTELAQLLTNRGAFFDFKRGEVTETRAFFDFELKNQGEKEISVNKPYGRFDYRAEHSKPMARVISDMKYAKSKPDSVMAKRFLRDLYQIVYYMLGDENSGFKPESISDKAVLDKINLMRMGNTKSLTEKLQLALDNKSINFMQFIGVANEFANALHNGKTRAYDKKLVELVEAKLIETAETEIKNVDLSPDSMDNQADNLREISVLMTNAINRLYPAESLHKTELLKNWDELHVQDKAFARVQQPTKEQTAEEQPVEEQPVDEQSGEETKIPEPEKTEVQQVSPGLFKRAAASLKNKWFKKNVPNIGKEVTK